MQAIILAGGFGTRLGKLTEKMPKAMMDINGNPFLEHQLELLKNKGFTEIILSTGYKGNMIRDYFSKKDMGLNILFSQEDSPLGTGGALRLIKEKNIFLDDFFFIINGDTFLNINYKNLFSSFSQITRLNLTQEKAMIITGVIPGKNNLTINKNKIIGYDKETPSGNAIDAGAILIKKEILGYICPGKPVSFEKEIYPILINKKELLASLPNIFYDIGSLEGLRKFRQVIKK